MTASLGRRRREGLVHCTNISTHAKPKNFVRYRCLGVEYLDLAVGAIDFGEYGNLKPWDHAAGLLIHSKTGGYAAYTDIDQPYEPAPPVGRRLLAAPDHESWREIRTLLELV